MPAWIATLVRALLVWILVMVGESFHGVLRRVLLSPDVMITLRQVSVLVGVLIVFAVTWFCLPWLRLRSTRSALAVGGLWIVLTLGFEIGLGRLAGHGWDRIFTEYDLTRGGLMPLGLLAMGLIPWIVLRLRTSPRNLGKTP